MRRVAGAVTACALWAFVSADAVQHNGSDDPFAFFAPTVIVGATDRARLERGEPMVRVLPARDGQVAIFAAIRLEAEPERLVAWTRAIAELKRGPLVTAIRRFSEPPALADLDGLVLDDDDLQSLHRCRPGSCDVKLAAPEMARLRSRFEVSQTVWKPAVQHEFRQVVLNRVLTVQREGLGALPPYADRSPFVGPRDSAERLLAASAYLGRHLPAVADALRRSPAALTSAESFFYWSQERFGTGKPLTMVTKVDIVRPGLAFAPEVIVLGREILATHYRNGSLGVTTVVRDRARQLNYFVYLNRSDLDVLGGLLGGVKRSILEGRLRRQAGDVVAAVKRRLEGPGPGPGPGPGL